MKMLDNLIGISKNMLKLEDSHLDWWMQPFIHFLHSYTRHMLSCRIEFEWDKLYNQKMDLHTNYFCNKFLETSTPSPTPFLSLSKKCLGSSHNPSYSLTFNSSQSLLIFSATHRTKPYLFYTLLFHSRQNENAKPAVLMVKCQIMT